MEGKRDEGEHFWLSEDDPICELAETRDANALMAAANVCDLLEEEDDAGDPISSAMDLVSQAIREHATIYEIRIELVPEDVDERYRPYIRWGDRSVRFFFVERSRESLAARIAALPERGCCDGE